jgi:hypothetical protein
VHVSIESERDDVVQGSQWMMMVCMRSEFKKPEKKEGKERERNIERKKTRGRTRQRPLLS